MGLPMAANLRRKNERLVSDVCSVGLPFREEDVDVRAPRHGERHRGHGDGEGAQDVNKPHAQQTAISTPDLVSAFATYERGARQQNQAPTASCVGRTMLEDALILIAKALRMLS